jgi:hypothetical protein
MQEIKDEKLAERIEKNPITKDQFEGLLSKACKTKPKSSAKLSRTKVVRPSDDCTEIDTR